MVRWGSAGSRFKSGEAGRGWGRGGVKRGKAGEIGREGLKGMVRWSSAGSSRVKSGEAVYAFARLGLA